MAKSDNLRKAKEEKNDEFYTQMDDIIAEIVQHPDYVKHFKGKTVLCNCDDPEWSAFVQFFIRFFPKLGIKKMISTHYTKDGSPSYKLEWSGEKMNGDTINMIKTPLKGDGDFRSDECIELLKASDIIVTNPPFSLYREYVEVLEKYDKKFIIIGNKNSIAYKEIFPLLKEGKMFVGYNAGHGTMKFSTTPGGKATRAVPSYWFTNLDIDKVHEPLQLTKLYKGNESHYPKYDNYDAIEVSKVTDIPKDYMGVMGVPITFMSYACLEQFNIIGGTQRGCHDPKLELKHYDNYWEVNKEGVKTGCSGKKTNGNPNLVRNDGKHSYFENSDGKIVQSCYQRILIQRKVS